METSSFQYDPAFIAGIQSGDRWCFELAYRLTIDRLKDYVRMKGRNYLSIQEREDVISVAYYHLFKDRAKVTCFNDIVAFLIFKSNQLLIDEYRKSKSLKNRRPVEFNYFHDTCEETEKFDEEHDFVVLKQGVDKLSKRFKQIIVMLFYEEKTMAQLSEELQISRQTILNIKNRAIAKLTKEFNSKDAKDSVNRRYIRLS